MKKEFIVTTEGIAGKEVIEVLGTVKGNTIRARHIGSDIGASLKSLVGGEIRGYVKALQDAREEAEGRMIAEAEALEADAILMTRYATSQVMGNAAEILVYGTAVKLR